MARSLKKGAFVDESIYNKIVKMNNENKKSVIKTWSRRSTIYPEFVDIQLQFIMVKILFQFILLKRW